MELRPITERPKKHRGLGGFLFLNKLFPTYPSFPFCVNNHLKIWMFLVELKLSFDWLILMVKIKTI